VGGPPRVRDVQGRTLVSVAYESNTIFPKEERKTKRGIFINRVYRWAARNMTKMRCRFRHSSWGPTRKKRETREGGSPTTVFTLQIKRPSTGKRGGGIKGEKKEKKKGE